MNASTKTWCLDLLLQSPRGCARNPTQTSPRPTTGPCSILFRLLFLAYAEDRGLLPYGRNPRYDRHAIKTLARDFADHPDLVFDKQATSLWDDMVTVWAAVDEGNTGWDVPAYNGGLFSRDPSSNPSGAALAGLRLADAEFGPVLRALLVDIGEDGTQGPVDFRSLSVREFGTIYEGLLESDLSVSQTHLTVDANGSYVPAGPGDEVVVPAGRCLHPQPVRATEGDRLLLHQAIRGRASARHRAGTGHRRAPGAGPRAARPRR